MICGEEEEGLVVSGVDELILLITIRNRKVTLKLSFLKATQTEYGCDNHEARGNVSDINLGEFTSNNISLQTSSSAKLS